MRSVLQALDCQTVSMILGVKGFLFLFGTQAYHALMNSSIGGLRAWLELWNRWDALQFIELARNGYQVTGEARYEIVHYPLLPWLIRLTALLFRDYFASGLIVAGIASVAAGLLLQRLFQLDHSDEIAERAVWFMFIFPTSYFLHVAYSESLLLAFVLGSFVAARTERWLMSGILGALACLSRANGVLLVPALAAEAVHQYWTTGRWRWQWLWIGFSGIGVLGYLLLNYCVHGNPFMFITFAREHWSQIWSWPWIGIREVVLRGRESSGEAWVTIVVQQLFFIALGLVATVWVWLKSRPSYAVWMICHCLLFTSTTFLISVPRYTLSMFPLYLCFSIIGASRFWYMAISIWSLLFLALFTGLYVEGHWTF